MKRVGLAALQVFERTVRDGSQKAAAHALGITPTAVSHAVRALEARYGVVLLESDGRGVRPTPAGARLATRLRGAFEAIDDGLAELGALEASPSVSVTPGFAALWLAPRSARSAADGDELAIRIDARIECADPDQPGGPDLAIRYAETCEGELLATETFMAFHAPAFAALEREGGLTLIETRWRSGLSQAPSWTDWYAASGAPMPAHARIVRFDDEHLAVQSALAGVGRVLMSSVLASNLVAAGLLEAWRPETSLPGQSYWLLKPRNRRMSRPAQRAADRLTDWMKASG